MGVDKFGRHTVISSKGVRGPKGEGFNLTASGDFDVEGKRLCNVLDAKDGGDAVNLNTAKSMVSPCVKEINGVFDFGNKIVGGVDDPKNDRDAINLRTLKRKSLSSTPDGQFDIQNKRLCNVSNAVHENDAVNLAGLKSSIDPCMKEVNGVFNFKSKTVTGIEDPKTEQDAVSFKILKRYTLGVSNQAYNARGRKITNVKAPDTPSDAVILKYLNDNCVVKDKKSDVFIASGKRICSVSDPKEAQDVVTQHAMMMIITKLGWVLYNRIYKDANNKRNFTDWFNIIKTDPYSLKTWDDAFALTQAKDSQIVGDGSQSKAD